MLIEYFLIFFGGGIGSILRYFISSLSVKYLGISFPFGTLFVNILGSLFLGFVATLAINKINFFDPNLKLFLTIGFAGGFTTFSTFSFETLTLIKHGQILTATIYVLTSIIISLSAVYLGSYLARYV